MANTCIVYDKALTLHRVGNSVAKLAKITARSNNKNYLNFSYMDYMENPGSDDPLDQG